MRSQKLETSTRQSTKVPAPVMLKPLRKAELKMKTTTLRLKKLAIPFLALPLLAIALLNSASVRTVAAGDEASYYSSHCAMCHGARADKRFNRGLPESQMVQTILNGKKVEKPPFMPA